LQARSTYGKVADAASKFEPPAEIKLKDPKDWKIIGKGLKRLDTADKVVGKPWRRLRRLPACRSPNVTPTRPSLAADSADAQPRWTT